MKIHYIDESTNTMRHLETKEECDCKHETHYPQIGPMARDYMQTIFIQNIRDEMRRNTK